MQKETKYQNSDIEPKEWLFMTLAEIRSLSLTDYAKYRKYRRLFDKYYRYFISPLYRRANTLGHFTFQTPPSDITIAKLIEELHTFFEIYGIDSSGMISELLKGREESRTRLR